MDAAAELGKNPVSKHQIQSGDGDEQADAVNYNVAFREKILVIGSKSQHSSFVVQIREQRRGGRYIFQWFKVLGIYSNGCEHWL